MRARAGLTGPCLCVGLVLLIALAGCAKLAILPLDREMSRPKAEINVGRGKPVTGYITRDGEYHRYWGWVKARGDTLVFHGPASRNEFGQPEHRVPASEVTTLLGERPDFGLFLGTGASFVLGIAALTGLLVLALIAAYN